MSLASLESFFNHADYMQVFPCVSFAYDINSTQAISANWSG